MPYFCARAEACPIWMRLQTDWKLTFLTVCFTVLIWIGEAQSQANGSEQRIFVAPASAFAQQARLWNVLLNPSGQKLLSIEAGADTAQLVISDLPASSNPVRIEPPFGAFRWARWLNEKRIIASIEFTISVGSYTERFRRYIAVNSDGSDFTALGRSRSDSRRAGQGGDRLISFLSEDDDHVLISAQKGINSRSPSVYKVNIWTGRTQRIQSGRRNITSWLADRSGQLKLGVGYKDTESLIYKRRSDSSSWDLAYRFDVYKDPVFIPLAFAQDGKLFVLSTHESDRKSLYKFDLETGRFGTRIFQHPRYDLTGVILGGREQELLGASLSHDAGDNIYFDAERQEFEQQLKKILDAENFRVSSLDEAGKLATIFVTGSDNPGQHILVDLRQETATLLGYALPSLSGLDMPKMDKIEYRARDGLLIEGYLTKPKGYRARLPLIVMPHGGPGIRETDEFNPFTQFLVNRGYAVLQMNFRGSAGFGRRHLQSGYRKWGLDIQDDIEDGTRWAIAQGEIDPEKICLFGGSFGGYAALMGVIRSPDLYKCAASLNGVSDITLMLKNRRKLSSRAILPITIGDLPSERDDLRSRSPLYNIEKIQAPILLAHGLKDRIVSAQHSKRLAEKLQEAGHSHETIYFKDGTHDLSQPVLRARFLETLEAFLAANLRPKIN